MQSKAQVKRDYRRGDLKIKARQRSRGDSGVNLSIWISRGFQLVTEEESRKAQVAFVGNVVGKQHRTRRNGFKVREGRLR